MANWDTALGYALYCQGLSDGEIADACKVKISTIKSYRLRRWRRDPDGNPRKPESAPPAESAEMDEGLGACDGAAGLTPEMVRSFGDDSGELEEGVTEVREIATEDLTGGEETGMDEREVQVQEVPGAARAALVLEVIEQAVEGRVGIEAVCVADVIQTMCTWKGREDLLQAKAALEYLLERVK